MGDGTIPICSGRALGSLHTSLLPTSVCPDTHTGNCLSVALLGRLPSLCQLFDPLREGIVGRISREEFPLSYSDQAYHPFKQGWKSKPTLLLTYLLILRGIITTSPVPRNANLIKERYDWSVHGGGVSQAMMPGSSPRFCVLTNPRGGT